MEKRNKFVRKDYREKKKDRADDKRCPHCNGKMKSKGPKDVNGTVYWKCRNKKCGRTVDFRKAPPKEVIPLTFVDRIKGRQNG
jgi:tRNA(Ile2) C34 agmatinyltransferase TiaS